MTDKHNFTFRVRVQGLKGQPQSSHSKSFFNESILSMLWSKPFLFMTTFNFWGYITFLTRSTSSWVGTPNVKRLFKRRFLRHSVCSTQLWCVAHMYKDKKRMMCFSRYITVCLPLHVARYELRCALLSHDLQKKFFVTIFHIFKAKWCAMIHVNWDLDSEKKSVGASSRK